MLKYIANLSLGIVLAVIGSPVTHSMVNHFTTMGNGVGF